MKARMISGLAMAGVAALLFAASPAAAQRLTGQEIEGELIDKNLSFVSGGVTGQATYASDGSAKVSLPGNAKTPEDDGAWRIEGDALCVRWNTIRSGEERCFAVNRKGSAYEFSGGTIVTVQ